MTDWSFAAFDLSNASLGTCRLVRADFKNANLTNVFLGSSRLHDADFTDANLSGVELPWADLRGARNIAVTGAQAPGAIFPDGSVHGLGESSLGGGILRIANYAGTPGIPIRLNQHVTQPVLIRFDLDEDPWSSSVTFDPGILVDITGTFLSIGFDDEVEPTELFGRTFQLFDWSGVSPVGQFGISVSSSYQWDLSRLYTDGAVTLVGVPEPSFAGILLAVSGNVIISRPQTHRRRASARARLVRCR
jgi:hypothetical protein